MNNEIFAKEAMSEMLKLMQAIRADQIEQNKKIAIIMKRSWKASRKVKKDEQPS